MLDKIRRKLLMYIVRYTRHSVVYNMLYPSWWHAMYFKSFGKKINYLSAIPNRGAGIGHQMANWIAGYWFAQKFNLKFAHIPFSTREWDDFLNFGDNEVTVNELLNAKYKKVRLPLFNENDEKELKIIGQIIQSYSNEKVVFVLEQDQFYYKQYEVMDDLKVKFKKAHDDTNLIYDKDTLNIAVHVRRGDITIGQLNKNPNLLIRWQDNDYFVNVLKNVLRNLKSSKPIKVYLFSQGKIEDFSEFKDIKNVQYCLDMDAKSSFLHMVYADILITSKSSFSYKPALLSDGLKICPDNFWHGYPLSDNWLIADEKGEFDTEKLQKWV